MTEKDLAELKRLRVALETIRSWGNNDAAASVEMQQLAAEALFPGQFPTPDHVRDALRRAVEKQK
jgi:hypothetical protein